MAASRVRLRAESRIADRLRGAGLGTRPSSVPVSSGSRTRDSRQFRVASTATRPSLSVASHGHIPAFSPPMPGIPAAGAMPPDHHPLQIHPFAMTVRPGAIFRQTVPSDVILPHPYRTRRLATTNNNLI